MQITSGNNMYQIDCLQKQQITLMANFKHKNYYCETERLILLYNQAIHF